MLHPSKGKFLCNRLRSLQKATINLKTQPQKIHWAEYGSEYYHYSGKLSPPEKPEQKDHSLNLFSAKYIWKCIWESNIFSLYNTVKIPWKHWFNYTDMCKEVGKHNAYISNNWIHCSTAERQQKTNYYNSNLNEKKMRRNILSINKKVK